MSDASSEFEEAVAVVLTADAEAVAGILKVTTPGAAAAVAMVRALAAAVAYPRTAIGGGRGCPSAFAC